MAQDFAQDFANTIRNFIAHFSGSTTQFNLLVAILEMLYLKKENGCIDLERIKNIPELNYHLGLSLSTHDFFTKTDSDFAFHLAKQINGYIIKHNEYGQIADGLIKSFSESHGKSSALHQTPKEIIQLMLYLRSDKAQKAIYNPFAGLSSFALYDNNLHYYFSDEKNDEIYKLATLRLALHGTDSRNHYSNNDSISSWNSTRVYDEIITVPPFNLRIDEYGFKERRLEEFLVNKGLESLREDGKLIFTTANNFLIEGGRFKRLRNQLIKSEQIDTVISLPSNLLSFSSIPFSIVIVSKKQNKKVRMINIQDDLIIESHSQRILDLEGLINRLGKSDNKIERYIDFSILHSEDFSLSPGKYFSDLATKSLDSSIVVKLGTILKDSKNLPLDDSIKYGIEPKNLSSDFTKAYLSRKDLNIIDPERLLRSRISYKTLNSNSLLLNSIRGDIKASIYQDSEKVLINRNVYPFEIDEAKAHPEYILMELRKPYVENQLKLFSSGQMRVLKKDILDIKIELPSLDIQKERVNVFKSELIEKQKEKVTELQSLLGIEIADANSFLSHKIAGRLKNLRMAEKAINNILSDSGILQSKENKSNSLALADYLAILQRDIQYISQSVQDSKKLNSIAKADLVEFDLLSFSRAYSKELKGQLKHYDINIEFEIDSETYDNPIEIRIDGNKQLLSEALDNLVDNAVKHGFKDFNGKKMIELVLYTWADGDKVHLDIGNSGLPFPKNFSFDQFIRMGDKAKSDGSGFGGWFINEVVKKHNGQLNYEPRSEDAEEFDLIETNFSIELPVKTYIYE